MLDIKYNPSKVLGFGLGANVMGVFLGGILGNKMILLNIQNEKISVIGLIIIFITIILLLPLNNQLGFLLKNYFYLEGLSVVKESFIEIKELTKREGEIVNLLLTGRTYKMIAEELYLSENTIKTHIKNIYSKLNVKNKTELINFVKKNNE